MKDRSIQMKKGSVVGLTLLLLCLAAVGADRPVKPPFRVSLHADCTLGANADNWWVTVDRISATHTRIVFKPVDARKPVGDFTVPGILVEFQQIDTALVLTFNPGPTTRAFTDVNGKVQQVFECSSRFGAVAFPLLGARAAPRHCLVCLQGEQMVGRFRLPTTAKIYLYTESGYTFGGETPFSELYRKLAEIK
jgi:hypothetical protein